LAPTTATRSPKRTSSVTGQAEAGAAVGRGVLDDGAVEPCDDVAAAAGIGDLEAQVPALPRLVDRLEPGQRLLGAPRLAGQLLGHGRVVVADELVALARGLHPLDALRRPLSLGAGPLGQGVAAVDVGLVVLLGVLADPPPLVEVGQPPAVEAAQRAVVVVDLGDRRDRPLEERPVVRDDHARPGQAVDEALQAVEPICVEVVRRLVEQEHVEAGEQQRRQLGPGRLAARQAGHRTVEQGRGQAEVVGHGPGPRVDVGPAERQPPVEGGGVGVVGPGRGGRQRRDGGVENGAGLRHAGTPGQQLGDGLAGTGMRLLRQVADRGRRRRHADPAAVGRPQAGERAQQRRLAGAVRADQAQTGAGADTEVDPGEQGARPDGQRQVVGDQGRERR